MTKVFSLRSVPEPLARALKRRARRNDRSMQKEILALLESAVLDREAMSVQIGALRRHLSANLSQKAIRAAIDEGRS